VRKIEALVARDTALSEEVESLKRQLQGIAVLPKQDFDPPLLPPLVPGEGEFFSALFSAAKVGNGARPSLHRGAIHATLRSPRGFSQILIRGASQRDVDGVSYGFQD
jgi:hypothetical protein